MLPIHTQHTSLVLGAPQGWDAVENGPCIGLPVYRDDTHMYSWWHLTLRERISVLFGTPIRLCLHSRAHPPVALHVTKN